MVSESAGKENQAVEVQVRRTTVPAFLRLIGWLVLKLSGWQIEGQRPEEDKYVAIFAPHTSNWDFPFMMAVIFVLNVRAHWFGKQELFWGPLGPIFKWMGGVPIDRSRRTNMVGQAAEALRRSKEMVVGVAPEGTRSHTDYWKSGFYHIAQQAGVPIVPAYLDYQRKVGGFGQPIKVSGDIEADMALIRDFYQGVAAKFPHEVGRMAVRPHLEASR